MVLGLLLILAFLFSKFLYNDSVGMLVEMYHPFPVGIIETRCCLSVSQQTTREIPGTGLKTMAIRLHPVSDLR